METTSVNSQLQQIDANILTALHQSSVAGAEPYVEKATCEIDKLRQQNLPADVRKHLDSALNYLNEPYSNILDFDVNLCGASQEVNKAEEAESMFQNS